MESRRRVMRLAAGLVLGIPCAPFPARAQTAKTFRIGWLGYALPANPEVKVLEDAFVEALRAQGFVEGRNIVIERRWSEGRKEQAAAAAAEFVQMQVDVMVAVGPDAFAAKAATPTIPVVFANVGMPDRMGLVASLARPGGNVTGVTNLTHEHSIKLLQFVQHVFPQHIRLAILWDATNPVSEIGLKEGNVPAAKSLGMVPIAFGVRSAADLELAFDGVVREQADVLFPHASLWAHRARIQDFAVQQKLPSVSGAREWAELGALLSYGPNTREIFTRSAVYVAKILKGAKPADLPVEQPMKFELVINMRTAKAIGIDIPTQVRKQADQIIE
ncbi:ABC transporter substrate-binding protein [Variovorax brevis]|uniref:ABC transporter substrate-binding protein n=1 Tax=Variovorax brevis TaxID=3053503 RepID=UPI0025763F06|nr:ABC transporter substrate-binding protein [Variovorax sp. J22R133]